VENKYRVLEYEGAHRKQFKIYAKIYCVCPEHQLIFDGLRKIDKAGAEKNRQPGVNIQSVQWKSITIKSIEGWTHI